MTCKRYDIPKTLIWEAWLHVRANQGAAGIDAETIERFEAKLGANLYKLWNRMSSGSYFPPPVKAVPIPKKSGGVRILGIPTVADRIGQTAVKMWLEPRLDPIGPWRAVRRCAVVVFMPTIGYPFCDTASHIVESEGVGRKAAAVPGL